MLGRIVDFFEARRVRNRSKLGRQIEATLCSGMAIPNALELLFQWIEAHRYFVDTPNGRIGFLFPEAEMKDGWSDLYQFPVRLTHEGDSQSGEFLNLWLPVGGHGHGCSDRIAGRL